MKTKKRKNVEQQQSTPTVHSTQAPPSLEQIRQRAHQIYLARGGVGDRELDDWLQAEREIRAGRDL